MFGREEEGLPRDRPGAFKPRALAVSVCLHVGIILFFAYALDLFSPAPETVIPIDLTIVPSWAEQKPDDPDPDPNPPPEPEKPKPKPKPAPPKPEPPKPAPPKNVDAVEKVVEKKKPEKINLRDKAKLVKDAPKPPGKLDLRDRARKIDAPKLPPGKATAQDKPLSPEEFARLMNQGYRIGAKNQIAQNEVQLCASYIKRAIMAEWDKESFKWYPGLSAIHVALSLGPGGAVRGFRIVHSSGDADVDRTANNALRRLRRIYGLTAAFLEQFPEVTIEMTPVSGN